MLSFHYALTKKDYCNFNIYVSWEAPGKRRKRTLYFLRQLMSIFIFTGLFYYTGLFSRDKIFSIVAVTLIVLTSILSVTGIKSSISKQAEKIADDPDNSSIFTNTHIIFSEFGIVVKDELTEGKFMWKAIIKKQENKEYYFLFYSSFEAIIIPKRIFKPLEMTQFEDLLVRNLSIDAEIGDLMNNL